MVWNGVGPVNVTILLQLRFQSHTSIGEELVFDSCSTETCRTHLPGRDFLFSTMGRAQSWECGTKPTRIFKSLGIKEKKIKNNAIDMVLTVLPMDDQYCMVR